MSAAEEHIEKDHVAAAKKTLEAEGLIDWEVVTAEENQLQIDYDSPELPKQFDEIIGLLKQRFPKAGAILSYSVHKSRNGNKHVIVYLPETISIQERIAWQAVFGSDPKREALTLISVSRDEKNPILLFMEKSRTTERIPVEVIGRKYRTEE